MQLEPENFKSIEARTIIQAVERRKRRKLMKWSMNRPVAQAFNRHLNMNGICFQHFTYRCHGRASSWYMSKFHCDCTPTKVYFDFVT